MATKKKRGSKKWLVNSILAFICLIWLVPTFGLLVSSFRPAASILQTGWWEVFPHQTYVTQDTITLPKETDLREPLVVNGETFTDEELRAGVMTKDGTKLIWENRRARTLFVQEKSWGVDTEFTLDNYNSVLSGKTYKLQQADGTTKTEKGAGLSKAVINTIVVSIPATVIPILIATFAACAFAWLRLPMRKTMCVTVIMLLVVPLQVALIPILKD